MRLQTISPRTGGYLTGTRVSLSRPKPVQHLRQSLYVLSKTGHGTVLMNRVEKPRTDASGFGIKYSRIGAVEQSAVHSKHRDAKQNMVKVKRKWQFSQAVKQVEDGRPTTIKPCTVTSARLSTSSQAQSKQTSDPAPCLVPNRAFPFIKQTEEQALLGLHKPIGLILASAYLLGAVCQLTGENCQSTNHHHLRLLQTFCCKSPALAGLVSMCFASVNRLHLEELAG